MSTIADETTLRRVLDGSLSLNDTQIEQRPYHRNCNCALDKAKGSPSGCSRHSKISFAKKELWADSSLSMATRKVSPQSSFTVKGRENSNQAASS
ncbi:hypothetical protein NL676_012430 [Syzygium grande]|nr:hypothetical protein NL676_012430 [Syzygium grande]